MTNPFAVVEVWDQGWDEDGLVRWVENLRKRLDAPNVSLGLVFVSPDFFPYTNTLLEIIRVHGQVPVLAGCSGAGLVVNQKELEDKSAVVVALFHLPGGKISVNHVSQEMLEQAWEPGYWSDYTGVSTSEVNGWLTFIDPFTVDCETWLESWDASFQHTPIIGGLASGSPHEKKTQIFCQGQVHEGGGVVVSIGGDVSLASLVSQGCTPVGETYTITRADGNMLLELANRPAFEVLQEAFKTQSLDEAKRSIGNFFFGLAMDEYNADFKRGDFLIRRILLTMPHTGTILVGAWPRTGQTLQFQRRDPDAASEELRCLAANLKAELGTTQIYGGCLFSCLGRGQRLFGQPNHDAQAIQAHLGPLPLAGFFGNGEIGPVAGRNFLHGYTASLALFIKKS